MADEAEGLLHYTLRFMHSEFVCTRLRPFLLQSHPLKNECGQFGDGVCLGDFMRCVVVLPVTIIEGEDADEPFAYADGNKKYCLHIVGKDVRVQWQQHAVEHEHFTLLQT